MIEKNKYFQIVNLYKTEKNLTRLVYRIIKNDDEELSLEQIANRVNKITGRVKDIRDLKKQEEAEIENDILSLIERLKIEGATDITRKNSDIYYTKNEKNYFTTTHSIIIPIIKKYNELEYKRFYNDIELALKELIKLGYAESFEDKRYYISPYSNKRKIKSIITRYKATK